MAQSLFDEGRLLMEAGDLPLACKKLEESQAIDPGVGTALNIAHCYELVGRSASAWAAYVEAEGAARAAGQSEREEYAHERAVELAATIPKLTLRLSRSAQSLANLEVTMNGQAVGPSTFGTAIAVDPGDYALLARAPGYEEWSTTLQVRAGVDSGVLIPELRSLPQQQSDAAAALAQPVARASTKSPINTTRRSVSLALGGAGLVGVVVGTALALDAKSRYDRAVGSSCAAGRCTDWAVEQAQAARAQGNWATGASLIGGALLASGLVLWLTAPPAASTERAALRPQLSAVRIGSNGIVLDGAL
jgi:serine/threonine-protein kinase